MSVRPRPEFLLPRIQSYLGLAYRHCLEIRHAEPERKAGHKARLSRGEQSRHHVKRSVSS